MEYVIDGVPERLNGGVVGIGLFETVIVGDLVFGFDVGIVDLLLVIELVLDKVTDTVPVRVKGYVDGIGDRVTVMVVDGDGKPDAATVIGGERLLVTDTVLDNETVKEVLFVRVSDFVIEPETVGLRVNGFVDGIGDRVTVMVVDVDGKPDAGTVIGGERLLVTDTVLDSETVKEVLFVRVSDFVIEPETVGLRVN